MINDKLSVKGNPMPNNSIGRLQIPPHTQNNNNKKPFRFF